MMASNIGQGNPVGQYASFLISAFSDYPNLMVILESHQGNITLAAEGTLPDGGIISVMECVSLLNINQARINPATHVFENAIAELRAAGCVEVQSR